MLNEFNNIKKNPNESTFDFNVIFWKGMYKLFQVMRLGDDVYLTTYFNPFDIKMAYTLRDKDPRTLRDAYKMAINIESNRKASDKLERRDDPKFFNPRGNRKEGDKPITTKNPKDYKMDKVLDLLKNFNPPINHENKPNPGDNPQFNNHYNKQTRIQNYPYTTQWKDGKPIPNPTQGTKDKGTLDPLERNFLNMMEYMPWCIICQFLILLIVVLLPIFLINQQTQ